MQSDRVQFFFPILTINELIINKNPYNERNREVGLKSIDLREMHFQLTVGLLGFPIESLRIRATIEILLN